MLTFIIALFLMMIISNIFVKRFFTGDWLLEYLITFFSVGLFCTFGTSFFDLQVISLGYGVIPKISNTKDTIFIGKYLLLLSSFGFLSYWVFKVLRK